MKLEDILQLIDEQTIVKIKDFTTHELIIECQVQQTEWLTNNLLESKVKLIQTTKVRNLTIYVSL